MKKVIFKFWLLNILAGVVLFLCYRIAISERRQSEKGFLETVIYILEIFSNFGFSIVFLIGTILCASLFFLNCWKGIRDNYYLSLLTFLAIPSVFTTFILIDTMMDFSKYNRSLFGTLLIFLVAYLIFTAIQFLLFRKKIKTIQIS